MRVSLLLDRQSERRLEGELEEAIEAAIAHRGHHVARATPGAPELAASDLVVADAEIANKTGLVGKLVIEVFGIEFILIGPAPEV